jgi:hypothetical protein
VKDPDEEVPNFDQPRSSTITSVSRVSTF